MLNPENPIEAVALHRIVPVVVLDRAEDADPLGAALAAGGLPVAEVTFRTSAAAEAIRILADRGDLLVGAGTVLTPTQVDQAVDAGATFLVSPGLNPNVVKHAQDRGVPIVPGVCTPSDIERGLELGLGLLKFFPAEAYGGVATLSAISAPYRGVRFIPTGGIGPDNVLDYLRLGAVVACGGSWMVKPSLFADGDFSGVERAARAAVDLVASASE
ncbi:MAG: bifunctional 4-hydroxy-2-oxoglutarate aldolase/2-dehydro-3-deoxy-phosphogluconate aldolase [Planctomycetales bacterium]|nr:bifunctional 4-hydroxy-2-oxoglutarate aldolase/2-dehydro-3-deoxy-phosphogluconate aldolase [Planctomycetales bacterium]